MFSVQHSYLWCIDISACPLLLFSVQHRYLWCIDISAYPLLLFSVQHIYLWCIYIFAYPSLLFSVQHRYLWCIDISAIYHCVDIYIEAFTPATGRGVKLQMKWELIHLISVHYISPTHWLTDSLALSLICSHNAIVSHLKVVPGFRTCFYTLCWYLISFPKSSPAPGQEQCPRNWNIKWHVLDQKILLFVQFPCCIGFIYRFTFN